MLTWLVGAGEIAGIAMTAESDQRLSIGVADNLYGTQAALDSSNARTPHIPRPGLSPNGTHAGTTMVGCCLQYDLAASGPTWLDTLLV